MVNIYDFSAEITAELDILSINLTRKLATIMPLNPTCADIVRLAMINDISSKVAIDLDEMILFLGKPSSFVSRRVRHLERRGWIHLNKFTGVTNMGELFSITEVKLIKDLIFLVEQTRTSLEEMRSHSDPDSMAFA